MRIFRCNFAKFSQGHASGPPRMVVPSAVPWLLRPIHLRPFIWDHVHLKPRHLRPRSFETYSFETTSFETTVIWDLLIWDHVHMGLFHLRPRSFETTVIWDHIHLRPQSFETTFIWDLSHLRPHWFDTTSFETTSFETTSFGTTSFETTSSETTFIWDHIHLRPFHLRPHSFETTFIWDYIHFRSHSFYAMLKWSCFDLLCITFYDLPFTSLRETWSFASWQLIWSFARLRPSVCRGDSRWFPNAPALRVGSRGETGIIDPGPLSKGAPWW